MSGAAPRANSHAIAGALLLAACAFFAWHGIHAGLRAQGSDFTIYYRAGEAVLAGRDPTLVERFLYLPAFAVVIAPLALLPYTAALVLWQAGSLAALAWIVARVRRTCERELGRELPRLAWAPLLCVLRLVDSSLANGQVNLFVLAFLVGALDAWLSARDRRAGALLGCAMALKIVPGLFLLPFAWRGRWRAVLCACASAFVLVVPLSALALGWRGASDGLGRWARTQVAPHIDGGRALLDAHEVLPGQSLTAAVYRLLSDVPATSAGDDGPRANLVALDPESVKWIVRALDVGVLVVLALALTVSVRRSPRGARLREGALTACAALWLAPLVHKAHMVWLLLPYAVLIAGVPTELTPRMRRVRWTLVALSVVAIGGTTPALLGRGLATWALEHDAVFAGLACVTAALLVDTWGSAESRRAVSLDRGP